MKRNQHVSPIILNKYILQFFISLLIVPVTGMAQIQKVWALGDGEKVFREDKQHPDRNGNLTWDGKTIHLTGLYNEIMAFQVILENGPSETGYVEVSVDAPVHKASGKTIAGNTLKYGPAGTIEIFTQHYLQVKDSTPPNWFYGSPAASPVKMTGWIPDALIPVDALPGKGGFPVTISPMQNQGFWVDIHLPRNQKEYPAGDYSGAVKVMVRGDIISEIPLRITLLSKYLSEENKSNVWLYTSDTYPYYPDMSRDEVDKMIKAEGHRHRIDVVGGFGINMQPFNADNMEKYKSYFTGDAFTPHNGYHGTGEGVGEKLFPIGMYGTRVMGNTKKEVQQQADLWVNWFNNNAPDVKYFWYLIDEPLEDKYPWIKERAEWVKTNDGPGKSLPIFTTTHYHEALKGSVDIWAAFNGVDLNELSDLRKRGEDHWFYNGHRPRYGSVILEAAAVDFRVNSWILYKYGISTWFLWHGTQWKHNGQGPKSRLHQNVFINPLTFINESLQFGNGDGIVFYPGHMPFYPEEERGLNRLIPSIRLKNIRRGQQDAAIMNMAEQKAGRNVVVNLINSIVPKALSEVPVKDGVGWSQKGDDYDQVRRELLKLL